MKKIGNIGNPKKELQEGLGRIIKNFDSDPIIINKKSYRLGRTRCGDDD